MTTGPDARHGWFGRDADGPRPRSGGGGRAPVGYVAGALGAVAGATAGVAAGRTAGPAVFAFTLDRVRLGAAERDSGLAGVVEAIALALALVVVAAAAAAAVALAAAWLGSALGCGLALRLTRQDRARHTALVLAAVEPPVVLAALWLVRAMGLRHAADLATALSVAASACLARRLAVPD